MTKFNGAELIYKYSLGLIKRKHASCCKLNQHEVKSLLKE